MKDIILIAIAFFVLLLLMKNKQATDAFAKLKGAAQGLVSTTPRTPGNSFNLDNPAAQNGGGGNTTVVINGGQGDGYFEGMDTLTNSGTYDIGQN